ncbi:unnamed protein product [Moneuplotes crassus]|uniref:Protein kinase domain-containing protein n=1 Tax=Euplotes crassus TaxID=5936 RepID=A0AAD1UGP2_EUPCR|nr:unnamed protein product [Moneuplotes crassus]
MNNYHIYDEIGHGKYSTVYKGKKKKSIQYVAVKSVEKNRRKKVINEHRILKPLDHPNILKFYNYYETRNHLWLIFDFCPGGDIYKMLNEDKKFPEKTTKHFGVEILKGLHYLHANGIIYGDLKPSTILFNEYNELKLADFGRARKITDYINPGQETYAKAKTGSPYYMAPELFQDEGVYSFCSDIWSFGCLLFEFLTGKPPFNSNSLNNLIKLITEDPTPVHLLRCSQELKDMISLMLEKDPADRITWEELIESPYWEEEELKVLDAEKLPDEPQFDAYLKRVGKVRRVAPSKIQQIILEKESDLFLKEKANNLAKHLLGSHIPSNVNVLRLSYNVKRNMENTSHEEIEVQGDDLQINNQNIELDFAEENEEDESMPADEYINPSPSEKHLSDLQTKHSSSSHGFSSGTKVPGSFSNTGGKEKRLFEKIDPNKVEVREIETDEFCDDIDQKFKNMMKVEKRDFKNISTMGQPKSKRMVSAHSEQNKERIDQKYFKTEIENIDEKPYTKIALTKGRSFQPEKKSDNLSNNYIHLPEKKYQPFMNGSSSKSSLNKFKSAREPALMNKEFSKNGIQFYPESNNFISSPSDKSTPTMMRKLSSGKSNSATKKMCPKSIDELMIHHSDTAVKPIIGNKDIEKIQEPVYKPDYLTFIPLKPEEFEKKIDSREIQNYMSEIYDAIVSNTNLTERVHALSYFESLIISSNVANTLINSAFLGLFVHIMSKSTKSHMIKIRICSIIGLLIRHATVIENEVAESGICNILCRTLQDSKENVRRKAIAALGEYLFYAATQLDDDQASKVWVISDQAIETLLNCMEEYQDEVVRFYACKAIENITAQSDSAGLGLATSNTCKSLIDAFLSQAKESFINTAAVALSNVVKLNPKLFSIVLDFIPLDEICNILNDSHTRVQQAFITMLNIALLNKNESLLSCVNESGDCLCQIIVSLLESQSLVIRGKSLLAVVLLLKIFPLQWFTLFINDKKFITLLGRLVKDSYKYVQYGLMHFIDQMNVTIPIILNFIEEDLTYAINIGDTKELDVDSIVESVMERRNDFKNVRGHMTLISLLLNVTNNQLMKARIVSEEFLESIARLLNSCELTLFKGADEMINAIIAIMEAISVNQKTLTNNSISIVQHILPALMEKIRSENSEVKFMSLKVFNDIIVQYLYDENVFDVSKLEVPIEEGSFASESDKIAQFTTEIINDILILNFLPIFKYLLNEEDPIPIFAIKLLSALTERSQHFINAINKLGISAQITEYCSYGHKRINPHTMQVIKKVIDPESKIDPSFGGVYQNQ